METSTYFRISSTVISSFRYTSKLAPSSPIYFNVKMNIKFSIYFPSKYLMHSIELYNVERDLFLFFLSNMLYVHTPFTNLQHFFFYISFEHRRKEKYPCKLNYQNSPELFISEDQLRINESFQFWCSIFVNQYQRQKKSCGHIRLDIFTL